MKIKKPLLIILALGTVAAFGQSRVLDGYIQQGLESNLQLKQETINYDRSIENLNVARAAFMPYIGLNASYSAANGGRKIQFPVGDLLNPIYKTLNQTEGTNFPTNLQNVNTQFLPNDFHDTKLRLIQPIFNSDIYYAYKAQKALVGVQEAQRMAYETELKFSIASAYYQYLESEEVLNILAQTRSLLEELVKINERLVHNDKATKDVLYSAQYELDKLNQQRADAEKNNKVAQAYFNFLLNRNLDESIERDTLLSTSVPTSYQLDDLSQTALHQRAEINQMRAALEANSRLVTLNKSGARLPRISVVADGGYQGYYYKFDNNQRYWMAQFSLTWDLFKGLERQAKIQQAQLDYQLVETKTEQLKKQIELQVIQSYHELEAARQAYATSVSGVKSTEKSFQIVHARYNEGQAIMLEYIDAESKLTTARLTKTINQYEMLRKDAALKKTIANQ